MKIIDFHTHIFSNDKENFCSHKTFCGMSTENSVSELKKLGVSAICGSVLSSDFSDKNLSWREKLSSCNESALALKEEYGDFYFPGFHVHPDSVEESLKEIERMKKRGVFLIGELVPYMCGYNSYSSDKMNEIMNCAEQNNMIVSVHPTSDDDMDLFVQSHKNLTIVAAHPGEYPQFMRHLSRMKMSENYYLDLSGYGIFRYGMLRHGIDEAGVERFIFGSDYPLCNEAMYIGGVANDLLITEEEKQSIFYKNFERLLKDRTKTAL